MTMMGPNHIASMISMAPWAQCARAWWSVASAPDHRDLRERPRPLPMVPAGGIVADDATLVQDGDGRWEL